MLLSVQTQRKNRKDINSKFCCILFSLLVCVIAILQAIRALYVP